MDRESRFVKGFLWTAGVSLFALLGLNFLVDPYDVFAHGLLPHSGELQERYRKIEYLRGQPRFNAVLLGSSRAGAFAPEDIERVAPGLKVYNLSVSQANQWDNLAHVRWLLDHKPEIRHILIQADFPFNYGPDRPGYAMLTKLHPEVSGESVFAFFQTYLFSYSWEAFKAKLDANLHERDRPDYSLETGHWSYPARDALIEADCGAYVAREPGYRVMTTGIEPLSEFSDSIRRNVEDLRRIRDLAASHGVELTVFIAPHYAGLLDTIPAESMNDFLTRISAVLPVWNFAYYAPETMDSCNYYEKSHFRRPLAAKVVQVLFGGGTSTFGRRVSAANIAAERAFILRNFQRYHGRLDARPGGRTQA